MESTANSEGRGILATVHCLLSAVWRVLQTVKVGERQPFRLSSSSSMESAANSDGRGILAIVHCLLSAVWRVL